MNTLNVTSDASKQAALIRTREQLVTDGFGTILYQDPDIVGYDSQQGHWRHLDLPSAWPVLGLLGLEGRRLADR